MGHSGEIRQLQPCFTTWFSFALSATLVLAWCTTPTALLCPSTLPTRSQLLPIWPPRRTPAHTTTLATTTSESVRLMLTLMLAWCTTPTALLCPSTLPTRSQLLPIWPPRRTPAHTTMLATTTFESVRLMLTLMLAWCTTPTVPLSPTTPTCMVLDPTMPMDTSMAERGGRLRPRLTRLCCTTATTLATCPMCSPL